MDRIIDIEDLLAAVKYTNTHSSWWMMIEVRVTDCFCYIEHTIHWFTNRSDSRISSVCHFKPKKVYICIVSIFNEDFVLSEVPLWGYKWEKFL